MNLDIKKFQECLNNENLSKEQIDWLELMFIRYPNEVSKYFKGNFEDLVKMDKGAEGDGIISDQDASRLLSGLIKYTDKEASESRVDEQAENRIYANAVNAANVNIDSTVDLDGTGNLNKADQQQTDHTNRPHLNSQSIAGRRIRLFKSLSGVAAILILLIVSSFLLRNYLLKTGNFQNPGKISKIQAADGLNVFYNFRGIPTDLNLSDGSHVQLMAQSMIRWGKDFGKTKKQVFLTGDALFLVHRDIHKDFSVITNEVEIKDLGTEFLVKNKKSALYVKLLRGKVVLTAIDKKLKMDPIFLKPGEVFRLNKSNKLFTLNNLNLPAANSVNIKPEKISEKAKTAVALNLNFKNQALDKVLNDVAIKYGKKIKFDGAALKEKSFTGDISKIKDLEQVLTIICFTNGLQYQVKEDSIIVW